MSQRTQLINAIRGHLSEYGLIAPQGPSHVKRLIAQVEDSTWSVPDATRSCLSILVEALRRLQDPFRELDAEISARAKSDETAHRLMSVPVVGPLIATALEALAPSAETFPSGLGFAAWIGLTPIQRSTGGRSALHEHRVCARVHVPAFASAAYLFSGHRAKRPRADGGGKGQ